MAGIQIAEYGSWRSPITSDLIVSETVRLSDVVLDGRDVYWVETRPSEGGRNVMVRCTPDGQITDITPADFNVRTRVHEYGGRSFMVDNSDIYFSKFQPQWSPDGTLYFVSDRTGWWNLYRWEKNQVKPLVAMEAEFGLPQWVFGMSTYAFEKEQHGFRLAQNIKRALDAELYFYSRIFGFEPADDIEPVEIDNL